MCDTFASIGSGGALFAKNSDRGPREPQVIEFRPPRRSTGTIETQYIEIPDADACAMVLSRPTWLWGAEHGVNEHGLAIGNERVYSARDLSGPPALIGMDLVRLALERARTAADGVDVITDLLTRFGQGGSGVPDDDDPYDSSFLLADAGDCWVVETSGRDWVAGRADGHAAISNRYTLGSAWTTGSGALADGESVELWHQTSVDTRLADHRLSATGSCAMASPTPEDAVATQRFHGTVPWGAPGRGDTAELPPSELGDDLSGITVCMHIPGYQATTAAMICSIPADDNPIRIWGCLGSPCCGVYVPFVFPHVPAVLSDLDTVARFADLRDMVEADHEVLHSVRQVLDPLEHELWSKFAETWGSDRDGDPQELNLLASEGIDEALTRLGV